MAAPPRRDARLLPRKTVRSPASRHGIVSTIYSGLVPVADSVFSKPFQSTYYDERMRAQPALLRARAPYLVKNTITGAAICTLVIGICMLRLNV